MSLRGRRAGLFLKYFAFIGLLVSVGPQAPVPAFNVIAVKPHAEVMQ